MIIDEFHKGRKKSIEKRLEEAVRFNYDREPTLTAKSMRYEVAEKTEAIDVGGIGMIHKLALESGLVGAINSKVRLLKFNFPYRESDHILNIAYNALCGGTCLEDIEQRRNNETYLNALGAESIPDPTTAGDFCRRFKSSFDIAHLQDAIDEARLNVWKRQPDSFFDEAVIDMDGHVLETTGSCKEGMDISYNGKWGYHPLIVSLANTSEVLGVMNRPGNWHSQQRSAWLIDRAIGVCRRGGFRRILLRGDAAFSQTGHFDRWDKEGIVFHFRYDSTPNLQQIADDLPETAWKKLRRRPKDRVRHRKRRRPDNVKQAVVFRREFEVFRLQSEEVTEFDYQPTKCGQSYRVIVVRKNISREKGENRLFDEVRYFFHITNDRDRTAAEVVFSCNDRCDQENLLEQLKNGARALHAPVDNLLSNWAYMIMTTLAWNLKVWAALWLPENGRWSEKRRAEKRTVLRMDFRTFTNQFIRIPCQIVHSGGQLIYRLLNWNPWFPVFWRLTVELRC